MQGLDIQDHNSKKGFKCGKVIKTVQSKKNNKKTQFQKQVAKAHHQIEA